MFRAIISPILRSPRLCLQLLVQCTDDAAGRQHHLQSVNKVYSLCIIPQAVNTV